MIHTFDTPPHIDYLSKDYAGFRQLMRDHMSVLLPNWTERSAADLGEALVELLAYAADYLSYYQDAVATEAYLGTARLRRSVGRHAQLLDYTLHEGCNARVWVHVPVQQAGAAGVVLPRGTQLLTRAAGWGVPAVIRPGNSVYSEALAANPIVFETLHEALLLEARNQISFYTRYSPGRRVSLEQGATRAALRGEQRDLRLRIGDVLIFEEICSPASGRAEEADPSHRHPVRLTEIIQNIRPNLIEIAWSPEDALPFPLVLADDIGGQYREVCVARGNIILADHGRTIRDEALPPIPAQTRYRPQLRLGGLTYAVPYDHAAATWAQSAAQTVQQDRSAAMPAIDLVELGLQPLEPGLGGRCVLPTQRYPERVGSLYPVKQWQLRRDLLSSGVFARDYIVEMEDDGLAHLRFGFGEAGWQPSNVGAILLATYRVGNGERGNLGYEALAHIVTDAEGVQGVRNPLPALGGSNPQRSEVARLHAPHAFKTWEPPESTPNSIAQAGPPRGAASAELAPFEAQERCVTVGDYALVALRHSGVAHAVAQLRWTGSWQTAMIYVQRHDARVVDRHFRDELRAFMEPFRMAGVDLAISGPQLVPLQVALRVHLQPGHRAPAVRAALNAALGSQPAGFFYAEHFSFGQPVHRSQLIACAMAVAGVAWIEVLQFRRMDSQHDVEHIPIGPLEIACLDSQQHKPESGTLHLELLEAASRAKGSHEQLIQPGAGEPRQRVAELLTL